MAVYKCSAAKCMYPFRNFRFKNFTENTDYVFVKIEKECPKVAACDNPTNFESDVKVADSKEEIATYQLAVPDFDLSCFGAFDSISDVDAFPQEYQPSNGLVDLEDLKVVPVRSTTQSFEEPLDLNGIDAMLDDLIASSCDNYPEPIPMKIEKISRPSSVEPSEFHVIEPKCERSPVDVKPLPKLSRCIEQIRKKSGGGLKKPKGSLGSTVKTNESPSFRSNATAKSPKAKLSKQVITLKPIKERNVNQNLISLVQNKDGIRPLSFLGSLTSMNFNKASSSLIHQIVEKTKSKKT